MTNRLIIIGNGLGRAIDKNHFLLETALNAAWDSGVLAQQKKNALSRWAMLGAQGSPTTEEQFGRVFVVMREAWKLQENSLVSTVDLTEDDIRSFCHKAACHFHEDAFSSADSERRKVAFVDALQKHIASRKTSIATLNYDRLLYGSMVKAGLDDGFRGRKHPVFSPEALTEALRQGTPLYLHLHGSPLFLTEQKNRITKMRTVAIAKTSGSSQSNLILNNSYFKQVDIEASVLLKSYWHAYRALVAKANRIILFGYSGCDDHLNATINILGKGQVTRVVEFESKKRNPTDPQREIAQREYWDLIIPGSELCPMQNILDFGDWEQ